MYAGLLVRSKEEEEEGEHNAPGRDERGKGGVGNGGGREGGRGAGRVDDKGEAGERVMHKADQVGCHVHPCLSVGKYEQGLVQSP